MTIDGPFGFSSTDQVDANQVLSDAIADTTATQAFTRYTSAVAHARAGAVGADASATMTGTLAYGYMGGGAEMYVRATATDRISISEVVGTPHYLRVLGHVSGTSAIHGNSQVHVGSIVTVGPGTYYYDHECAGTSYCGTRQWLSVAGEGLTEVTPDELRDKWLIPVSALDLNLIGIAVDLQMRVIMLPQVEGDGISLRGLASSNYANTTRVGGLQLLDSNFTVLGAKFTSESGHDYTQQIGAVPEPASMSSVLMGLGCLGVMCFRRR